MLQHWTSFEVTSRNSLGTFQLFTLHCGRRAPRVCLGPHQLRWPTAVITLESHCLLRSLWKWPCEAFLLLMTGEQGRMKRSTLLARDPQHLIAVPLGLYFPRIRKIFLFLVCSKGGRENIEQKVCFSSNDTLSNLLFVPLP